MAIVYKATQRSTGRQVAIKRLALSREFSTEDLADVRERFTGDDENGGDPAPAATAPASRPARAARAAAASRSAMRLCSTAATRCWFA